MRWVSAVFLFPNCPLVQKDIRNFKARSNTGLSLIF